MSLTRDDVTKAIEGAVIEVRLEPLEMAFLNKTLITGNIVAVMLNADANDEREYRKSIKEDLQDLSTSDVFSDVLNDKEALSEKILTASKIANQILDKICVSEGPDGIVMDP